MLNILKVMGGFTLIYSPFGDLVQRNFHKSFHVCIDERSFLRNYLINNELKFTNI